MLGFNPRSPATMVAYRPGVIASSDVPSLGEAVARACDAIDAGADLAVVRDTLGIMQVAMDAQGRTWCRGDDQPATIVAEWGHAS